MFASSLVALGCSAELGTDREDAEPSVAVAALTQEVFFDNFSSGLGRFVESGEGDWNTEALISSAGYPATGSGAPAAHSDGCASECSITTAVPIDLRNASAGQVTFLRFVSSLLDAGEFLAVDVWNGSAFVRVRNFTDGMGDDSSWRTETIDLAPYLSVADFRVRFVTRQSSTLEHVHVDDVRISIETGGTGPTCGDAMCTGGETCTICPQDCGACPGATLFSDGFASLSNWSEAGEGDWNVETLHATTGYPASGSSSPAAHSDNCDTACTLTLTNPINLTGVQTATLSFLRFVDAGLDAGDYLRVELFDGASWNTAFFYTGGAGDTDRWQLETVNLSGYVGIPNFRIRLSTRTSEITEHVHIDDVRVTGSGQPLGTFVVSQQNLQTHVQALASSPRASGTPALAAARDYCAQRLTELGYTVERQSFNLFGVSGQNVIGTRLGTSLPSRRVLLSAHIDSVADCPGADDNATGVAGMLETARLIAQAPHARTFVVACWDEEEVGMVGSEAYAERAAARGDAIDISFVFDQIGFRTTAPNSQQLPGGAAFQQAFPAAFTEVQLNQFRGDFIGVISDSPGLFTAAGAVPFVSALDQAAADTGLSTIGISLNSQTIDQFQDTLRSDHASFWNQGYTALLITDSGEFRSPYYHCRFGIDALNTLDYDFARRITQATALAVRRALAP